MKPRRVETTVLLYPVTRDGAVVTVTDFEATLEPTGFGTGERVVILPADVETALARVAHAAETLLSGTVNHPDHGARTAALAKELIVLRATKEGA